MKAIGLQQNQAPNSSGKFLLRLFKMLLVVCGLGLQPVATQAAGVTIITHGFRSGTITWVDEMFWAMVQRADFPGATYTAYGISVTKNGPGTVSVALAWEGGNGPSFSDSGELFVLLDWSDVDSVGPEETWTTTVAEEVVPKLLSPSFVPGLGKSLAEFPIHMVGHSRGASLVTGLARILGENGIIVDQVTTLDPHPLPFDEHAPGDNDRVAIYRNVVFADNYYRNGLTGGPDGFPVEGAKNIILTSVLENSPGVTGKHTDVHTYYHGTIDTNTLGPIDQRYISNSWYATPLTGPRWELGYCWSRKVGDPRPVEGISSVYLAGGAARVALTLNSSPQWPNVIIKEVTDTSVTVGSPLEFSCWYRDTDSGGNITVYLDQDRNPYNNNSTLLTQASATSYTATSSNPATRAISANTTGVTPNIYYLCLKITDSSGLTRYDYWREPIEIVPVGVLVQTAPNDQGLRFSLGSTNFSSIQNFQLPYGSVHTLSVVTSQQGDDGRQYVFQRWSDNNFNATRQITNNGSASYTAIFATSDAITKSFESVADSHVISEYPGQKSGGNNFVAVSYANTDGHQYQSLVRFNLGSIPPGSTIADAELRMTTYAGNNGPDIRMHRVLGAWTESTVCWTNRPPMAASIGAINKSGNPVWTFSASELSSLKTVVKHWVDGPGTNYGAYLIFDDFGPGEVETIWFQSKEGSAPPELVVEYTPPPDTSGDPIVNLRARKTSSVNSSSISANSWQRDNDPYFWWGTTNTISPVVGYSARVNAQPLNVVNLTVPYTNFPTDSLPDGTHTFYVKSYDAADHWGPVASFVIRVDTTPPTSGTISMNSGATSTWSPIVSLNNLGASDGHSGVAEMKFSNDGTSWTAYENYAATKSGWDLFANGGNTNAGTKTVYVRYKDNAGNESAVFLDTILYSPAPTIIFELTDDIVSFIGGSANLAVVAEGFPPLAYQWKFNGAAISGATDATLTLTNLQINQSGLYNVTVSNPYGSVSSAGAWVEASAVVGWGDNEYGQPGGIAKVPKGLTNVIGIAAGGTHNLALRADGSVVEWGEDLDSIPEEATNIVQVAAGEWHSLALRDDGRLFIWGDGWEQEDIPSAARSNVVAIAAGEFHSLVLKSDGTVVEWGGESQSPFGLNNVVGVAAGGEHSLAVRSDGKVFAWGGNRHGQTDVPADLVDAIAVAAGWAHSVALKSDGTVVVWGEYEFDGYEPYPYPDGLSNVVAIAAGGGHSLALREDGSIYAWGKEWYGQLNIPIELGGIRVAAISAGQRHSLALIGNGPPIIRKLSVPTTIGMSALAVLKAEAFGEWPLSYQWQWNGQNLASATEATLLLTNVQFSQSGFYSVIVSNAAGVASSVTNELTVVPVLIVGQPLSQVCYLGNDVTLSVFAQGAEPLNYQWSYNGDEIQGATSQALTITKVQFGDAGDYFVVVTNLFGVSTSQLASIAVSSVVPWGYYDPSNGLQLMTTPTGLTNVVAIAAGQNHGVLLQSDGSVATWGGFRNLVADDAILPMTVPNGLSNVVAIAAGDYHSLALRDDGKVAAWGGWWAGQTNVPAGLSGVVAIASGAEHSLALTDGGTVVAWGNNGSGQLDVPEGLSNVVAIAAGSYHSVALKGDGTVTAWGDEWFSSVPEGLSNVVAISCGWLHTFALKSDGTTVFWGEFDSGDLEPPDDLVNVIAIASGPDYCLALRDDGAVSAWGSFYDDWTGNYFPIVIPEGLKNIVSLAAGGTFSLALLGDGSPILAKQPIARTIYAGDEFVLNAMAGGAAPLSYQWQFNGVNINAETNAQMMISLARVQNSGRYSVIVSNEYGVAVGGPWLVTVPRPANDSFAERRVIDSDFGITTGNNLDATKEAGEPHHAGAIGGSSVWWTWTPSRAGTATITTDGSSFDTVLAVYTGQSVGELAFVAANDDLSSSMQSEVVFPVQRGLPYHIAVDGKSGNSGNIVMTLSFEGPHLTEATVSDNIVKFILSGPVGNPYQLQVSTNLVDWDTIGRVWIPQSGSILLTDESWSDHPRRFYRVNFDERFFELLAYYPFDGDANDASGNGHHANFVNATLTADRSGAPGHAYSFNGSAQRIVIPPAQVFEVRTNITIAAWLKRNQLGVLSPIVCKDNNQPNGTSHFEFRVQPNNRLMFAYYLPSERGWKVSESSSAINDYSWHHVAVTYDGQLITLYIDGVSVGVFPQTTPMIPGNEPLQIGEAQAAGFSYLNGAVDEVYIYKRALSPVEIQRLFLGQ